MRRVIACIIFLIQTQVLLAQNEEGIKRIKEVKQELTTSKPDTNRVLLIAELCKLYQWNDFDSLEHYSSIGLNLAQQLNFVRGEVRVLNSQGIAYLFRGEIPKALNVLYRALRLAEEGVYKMETAISLNNIGSSYYFLGDIDRSLTYLHRAVAVNKIVPDQEKDIYWNLYIDFWIGTVFIDVQKYDSAKFYIDKVYEKAFDSSFDDPNSLRPTILMFYGYLYLKQNQLDSAYQYLNRSISIFSAYNDVFGGADAYTYMAMVFKERNQPDSVIYYATKGLELSLSRDYRAAALNTSRLLSEEYETSNPALAIKYLKIQLETIDSVYGAKKIHDLQKTLAEVQQQEQRVREEQLIEKNRQKQNLFIAGLGILGVIAFIILRNSQQRKKANKLLRQQKDTVEVTLSELKATQSQLIQSEKMASLGELTAGIAHEIQNPLNFVNNFSEVSNELVDEMKSEVAAGNWQPATEIANDLKANLEKILHHGKRADGIVKGMLQHSRGASGQREETDINALCDEYLRLAFHGYRAKDKSFNAKFETDFDKSMPGLNIVPQDIGRVVLNLINNAFFAVSAKAQNVASQPYQPLVRVTTRNLGDKVEIKVSDNGNGIPEELRDKIFQPFFTTKPTGQGTGLGLSLSYDIVKTHGGTIALVDDKVEGTEFIIELPISTA